MSRILSIGLFKFILFVVFSLLTTTALALNVQVQGLFKGAAVLMIDGKQRMLREGKTSPEGVVLIKADRKQAIVEINGERHNLGLSKQIISNYAVVERSEVAIPRNDFNQYITNAKINGKRIKVLVDTGATSMALNSLDAQRLGIDFKKGRASQVSTASGLAKAYSLKLKSVTLGDITVKGVQAVVIEGGFPEKVLLGMTYLNHVEMREKGGTLYLKSKY